MATKVVNNQVVEMTDEENTAFETYRNNKRFSIVMRNLRAKRDSFLAECDWTQSADSPLTDAKKTEWATYRTSLRNLTNGLTTVEQVNGVTWPTKPN